MLKIIDKMAQSLRMTLLIMRKAIQNQNLEAHRHAKFQISYKSKKKEKEK
jgi:hypothetical protein